MNNQTLSHAIDLTNEITVLDDILDAANNQPYLEFSFFAASAILSSPSSASSVK